jgi:hypothetical protein
MREKQSPDYGASRLHPGYGSGTPPQPVMPAHAGIHAFAASKAWMAGTSPAMTSLIRHVCACMHARAAGWNR